MGHRLLECNDIPNCINDIHDPTLPCTCTGDSDDDIEDVLAPTPKRLKIAKEIALKTSLQSGLYPDFAGVEGPSEVLSPDNSALDVFQLVWPESLMSLITLETNRYALQKRRPNWVDVTIDETRTFLGILILMGIHRLPRISNYWSKDSFLGVRPIQEAMSLNRFWAIWSNLHLVDNEELEGSGGGPYRKVKPLLDVLSDTFFKQYSPSQELSVDECMIKYKGRCKGKVLMPKKPIKLGYKVWCCSCSCCGYLCTFQLYEGKPVDSHTGEKVTEKGLVIRVVSELVAPYSGMNHVLYCDNFFTSGPLIDKLYKENVYVVGTIRKTAAGFPDELKSVIPPKGSYISESVDGKQYFVFNDRKVVCLVSNVHPASMKHDVYRLQHDGLLREQSVPPPLPAYNKYMGAVDLTGQLKRLYEIGRKSKRNWVRVFSFFFDVGVDNAHILHKHCCKRGGVRPKDLLAFRVELARLLINGSKSRVSSQDSTGDKDGAQCARVCHLKRVSEIGLKRGKCQHCLDLKREKPHHTSFGCSHCRVRLCKTDCFADYHNY